MNLRVIKLMVIFFLLLYGGGVMAKLTLICSTLQSPTGIAFNQSSGELYVTNWSAGSISKIAANGQCETLFTGISSPAGIIIDKENNLYVSSYSGDYILKIDAKGKASRISEGYSTPAGIAFANSGELLITNRSSGEIVALDLVSGNKRRIASGLDLPVGVTQLPNGSLVVSQYSGRLTLINSAGEKTELGAGFVRPGVGIVNESDDTVVVIDNGGGAVRRVNVLTGKTETLADKLSGAVALTQSEDNFYIGTWNDGSVYRLEKIK